VTVAGSSGVEMAQLRTQRVHTSPTGVEGPLNFILSELRQEEARRTVRGTHSEVSDGSVPDFSVKKIARGGLAVRVAPEMRFESITPAKSSVGKALVVSGAYPQRRQRPAFTAMDSSRSGAQATNSMPIYKAAQPPKFLRDHR